MTSVKTFLNFIKAKIKTRERAKLQRYISKITNSPIFLECKMTSEKCWNIRLDKVAEARPCRTFNNKEVVILCRR